MHLDFINKKGELKHVKFYMDKQTYELLYDDSINEEYRYQYLINEYHEYERERYYQRKYVSFDAELAESLDLIADKSNLVEDNYLKGIDSKELKKAISLLTPRQQEMVRLIYWEGKSQTELCKIYGVKKQAISDAMKRIHRTLQKILEKTQKI